MIDVLLPWKEGEGMETNYSPYFSFTKEEWSELRFNTPMTLSEADIEELKGVNEDLSMEEVKNIYLPLTRLINLYTTASQQLHSVADTFLGKNSRKVPYVIGVAGSVAVGKSTTARVIRALLSRWPDHPQVEIVTTDGFLLPNAELKKRGLMGKKGFPESYDINELITCLAKIKSGTPEVEVPVYSHLYYDIIPDEYQVIRQPDIVIVEGINVLQVPKTRTESIPDVFVSDFFDLSIYVDAEEDDLLNWYVERFKKLRHTAFSNPNSYFRKYANLSDSEAEQTATDIWNTINLVNLKRNIKPTKHRGDIILKKASNHSVSSIQLRKI